MGFHSGSVSGLCSLSLRWNFLLLCLVIILGGCCEQISDKKEPKGRQLQSDPQPEEKLSTREKHGGSSPLGTGVFTSCLFASWQTKKQRKGSTDAQMAFSSSI